MRTGPTGERDGGEEEGEEEDLFVFNHTLEGPKAPAVKPGRVTHSNYKLNGRDINVSFTHNSNVPIEVMVFIFHSDEIAIDVQTGLVTRHKTEINFCNIVMIT